jgi:hypothetical protein
MAELMAVARITAFRWRHLFLVAPTAARPNEVSGIIEADETFFTESFKGNQTIVCVVQSFVWCDYLRRINRHAVHSEKLNDNNGCLAGILVCFVLESC